MKNILTHSTLVVKDGDYRIVRTYREIYGGNYAVIDTKSKKAKTGLNLDAAFEVFRKLTLQKALIDAKMINL